MVSDLFQRLLDNLLHGGTLALTLETAEPAAVVLDAKRNSFESNPFDGRAGAWLRTHSGYRSSSSFCACSFWSSLPSRSTSSSSVRAESVLFHDR